MNFFKQYTDLILLLLSNHLITSRVKTVYPHGNNDAFFGQTTATIHLTQNIFRGKEKGPHKGSCGSFN